MATRREATIAIGGDATGYERAAKKAADATKDFADRAEKSFRSLGKSIDESALKTALWGKAISIASDALRSAFRAAIEASEELTAMQTELEAELQRVVSTTAERLTPAILALTGAIGGMGSELGPVTSAVDLLTTAGKALLSVLEGVRAGFDIVGTAIGVGLAVPLGEVAWLIEHTGRLLNALVERDMEALRRIAISGKDRLGMIDQLAMAWDQVAEKIDKSAQVLDQIWADAEVIKKPEAYVPYGPEWVQKATPTVRKGAKQLQKVVEEEWLGPDWDQARKDAEDAQVAYAVEAERRAIAERQALREKELADYHAAWQAEAEAWHAAELERNRVAAEAAKARAEEQAAQLATVFQTVGQGIADALWGPSEVRFEELVSQIGRQLLSQAITVGGQALAGSLVGGGGVEGLLGTPAAKSTIVQIVRESGA